MLDVIATIEVDVRPSDVVVTPDGAAAWVPTFWGNSIQVISTASNTVTTTVLADCTSPTSIALSPDGTRAYVPNWDSAAQTGWISVLTTSPVGVLTTIPIEPVRSAVAITPDGERRYFTCPNIHVVAELDLASPTVTRSSTRFPRVVSGRGWPSAPTDNGSTSPTSTTR
jgi:DNA-binding beta-propeller fold protein YncE